MKRKHNDRGLINLIGGPWWAINKSLAKILGFDTALWIADVFSKFEYFADKDALDEEGFFFNTQKNIKEDTGLSEDKQTIIIKNLVEKGILEVKKKGLPARNYYKFDILRLSEIIGEEQLEIDNQPPQNQGNQSSQNTGTSKGASPGLINKNKGNKNKEIISFSKEKDNTMSDDIGSTISNSSSDNIILRRRKVSLQEKPKRIPLGIQQIITVWNTSSLRKHNNPETKTYTSCINSIRKLMKGEFFYENTVTNGYQDRKFTKEEIIQAIHNFASAALNPDYEPMGSYKDYLKKLSFLDFLYNPHSNERSQFIKYLDHPPKLCIDSITISKDEHPEYTKVLKERFSKEVKGGIGKFNGREQAKFIRASSKIHLFFEANKKLIMSMFIKTPKDRIELVMEALMETYKNKICVGNLCSDYTFDSILPAYLERQAVLK